MVFRLVVAPPVLGEVSPSFLIQKEGETIDLFCEATATPDAIITWHKDGKEVVANDRVVVMDNRIQLNKLQRTDGGVYTCTFRNIVGQVGHTMKLVIEGQFRIFGFISNDRLRQNPLSSSMSSYYVGQRTVVALQK